MDFSKIIASSYLLLVLIFLWKQRKQPRKQKPWKNSEGVHLLNKVTGLGLVTLLKMKSFTYIFKDFAEIKIYLLKLTPCSGWSETTPHDNSWCSDSKANDHLILFGALWKQKIMSLLAAKDDGDRHLVHLRLKFSKQMLLRHFTKHGTKLVHEKWK